MALPNKTQIINEATPISSMDVDFFLIGWQGKNNATAPLICVSSAQLRDYINSAAGRSMLSGSVASVSLEELFDEAGDSLKDCFICYEVSEEGVSVVSSINVKEQAPILQRLDSITVISTGIPSDVPVVGTPQVTPIISGSGAVTDCVLDDSTGVIRIQFKGGPCKINLSYKVPLIPEGVQVESNEG